MYLRLSKAVSVVLHPFLVPLYMVSLLLLAGTVYSLYPLKVKIYLIWVTLLFTTIIPVLVIALLKSYRKDRRCGFERPQGTLHPAARYDRLLYVVRRRHCEDSFGADVEPFYVCGSLLCRRVSFCQLLLEDQPAYDGVGCCRGFYRSDQYRQRRGLFAAFIAALLAAGALGSARLKLGYHTLSQVAVGFATGFIVAAGVGLFNW